MDDGLRIKRLNNVRSILRNSRFHNMNAVDQARTLQTLIEKGLDPQDLEVLKKEYADELEAHSRLEKPREEPANVTETSVEYIMGNFKVLPRDVILQLIKKLPLADVGRICRLSPEFRNFCSNNNVLEKVASRELAELTPLSETDGSAINRLDWARRGQVTPYTIRFTLALQNPAYTFESVRMGVPTDAHRERIFYIKGCPPPRGTKVFVIGQITEADGDLNLVFWNPLVFLTLDDLITAISKAVNAETPDNGLLVSILEEDNFGFPAGDIPRSTIAEFCQRLLAAGNIGEYFLHHVELP